MYAVKKYSIVLEFSATEGNRCHHQSEVGTYFHWNLPAAKIYRRKARHLQQFPRSEESHVDPLALLLYHLQVEYNGNGLAFGCCWSCSTLPPFRCAFSLLVPRFVPCDCGQAPNAARPFRKLSARARRRRRGKERRRAFGFSGQ